MASDVSRRVVILYEHPLLGEGIAKHLRTHGVEATPASVHDPEEVRAALALDPAVVIFESSNPHHQFNLSTLAPHAVLIDVSMAITRGSVLSPGDTGLEQILQAVLDAGPTEPAASAPRRLRHARRPTPDLIG